MSVAPLAFVLCARTQRDGAEHSDGREGALSLLAVQGVAELERHGRDADLGGLARRVQGCCKSREVRGASLNEKHCVGRRRSRTHSRVEHTHTTQWLSSDEQEARELLELPVRQGRPLPPQHPLRCTGAQTHSCQRCTSAHALPLGGPPVVTHAQSIVQTDDPNGWVRSTQQLLFRWAGRTWTARSPSAASATSATTATSPPAAAAALPSIATPFAPAKRQSGHRGGRRNTAIRGVGPTWHGRASLKEGVQSPSEI